MQPAKPAPQTLQASNPVVAALGVRDARVLDAVTLGRSGPAFLEVACRADRGLTGAVSEDAYLVALQLQASADFDLVADGRPIATQPFEAGRVAIFDLRTKLAADLRDPFHAVDFYLPRAALDIVASDAGMPRIGELDHQQGSAWHDPVARSLLMSMRPALASRPEEVSALFVDHVATAMTVHVAHRYGGMRLLRPAMRGGLAPWQERRAKDLLSAKLDGGVSLAELAADCGISVRQFTRAFRQSTGMTAHQWLLARRLEKAKGLLARSGHALADIAAECGFADQSHFSRAFARALGLRPSDWRRIHRRAAP